MGIDIERLGPAAQKQVREELERRRRTAAAKDRQQKARDGPALRPGGSDRGSALEEEYYRAYIWPKELAGTVANVERHKKFELLPKSELLRPAPARCTLHAGFCNRIHKRHCGSCRGEARSNPRFAGVLCVPPPPFYREIRPAKWLDIHRVHKTRRKEMQ